VQTNSKRKRTDSADAASSDAPDTDSQRASKEGKYERGKAFQPEWFKAFPWLDEDASKGLNAFVCKFCTATNQANCAFNKSQGGAYKDNLRRDKLKLHEESVAHLRAQREVESMKRKSQTQVDSTPLLEAEKAELIKRAKMLMWLSAEEIAHAKFPSLCAHHDDLVDTAVREALKAAGVEVPAKPPRPRNAQFVSDYFARQMIQSLATVIENRHLELIKQSPAVSVLIDDSTDEGNIKQLSVVIRYVNKGESRVAFLGLIDIPDGGAETVYTQTAKLLADKGISIEHLFSFGSDGASPMTGMLIFRVALTVCTDRGAHGRCDSVQAAESISSRDSLCCPQTGSCGS
jgi:hypothetical protein